VLAAAAGLLASGGCAGGSEPPPAPRPPASAPTTSPPPQPSTPAPSTPAPSGPTTSALGAGAAGDGTTDDHAALQAALDALQPGATLVLDEGSTFATSEVLTIGVDGVTLTGGGTLLSTDEERSSLLVTADDVTVTGVTLAVEQTTRRFDAYEQQRLRLDATRATTVRDVVVAGSAATGVYVGGGSTGWLLERVTVRDTEADGIHITQGSSDGVVRDPVVERSGDDGVAVVSYARDGEPSRGVLVEHPVVREARARGISVVGGEDITYRDVEVDGSAAAGVYVAAEDSYDTTGVRGVLVDGGTVARANQDEEIDHGAVLVYSSTGGGVSDVTITGLEISGTRASASRQVGVLAAAAPTSGIEITDLTIEGGPASALGTDGEPAGLVTTGWTVDGAEVGQEELQG
jgi:hypothetical protein